ncbi:N-acetyltransferase [Paenibacillus montaniterrae]|uniref:N-acetyltransferase n=1 Tax=Paenibacillus montaniterrae TaxID=429341 RepID=A0A919YTJ1_9BACL|nr:GNAT family N-acetyltransferase [Paenibacillus montaniterrae]GIP18166.1 N-acetyltransferase [Paenibacillus montaniterrae]
MNSQLEIVKNKIGQNGCYCMRSMKNHSGYLKKLKWTEENFDQGLEYLQIKDGKKTLGFIEYSPGQYSWRAIHADNYMVIHCIWVGTPGMGLGSQLIQLCLEAARQQKMKGVAVLTNSDTGWAPSKELFIKNGFSFVQSGPYSFELYVYSFEDTLLPYFPDNWSQRLARFSEGLTILKTNQCPYLEVATENLIKAANVANIHPHIIYFQDRTQMMELSPTPYGVFNVVYNGRLIAYHRMTERSFLKALQKE